MVGRDGRGVTRLVIEQCRLAEIVALVLAVDDGVGDRVAARRVPAVKGGVAGGQDEELRALLALRDDVVALVVPPGLAGIGQLAALLHAQVAEDRDRRDQPHVLRELGGTARRRELLVDVPTKAADLCLRRRPHRLVVPTVQQRHMTEDVTHGVPLLKTVLAIRVLDQGAFEDQVKAIRQQDGLLLRDHLDGHVRNDLVNLARRQSAEHRRCFQLLTNHPSLSLGLL